MSSKSEFEHENPDEVTIAQSLARITPRPPRVDRDRLMFLAGAASAQRSGVRDQESVVGSAHVAPARNSWHWPAAAAALGATSLTLAIALVARPAATPQIVYVEQPAPVAPAMSPRVVVQGQTPTIAVPQVIAADVPRRSPRAVVSQQVPADNFLRSREVALRMGVDALGSPRSSGPGLGGTWTYFDWLAGIDATQSKPDQPAGTPLPNM